MLANPFSRLGARLIVAIGAVLLTGATLLSVPAGAQSAGDAEVADVLDALASLSDDTAVGRFDSPLAALLRAVHRADRGCVDAGPADADVPTMVGEIFRCRLREAGVDDAHVQKWAAEAVVVSRCESLWDTDAVVFDGRYLDTPHANGNRYSAAGVFQFIRATAEKWIEGGYANVHDPRMNIDAAARLFIHNRNAGLAGWEDWACVAANDGFKVGSVLAGWPGGPAELPAWAFDY